MMRVLLLSLMMIFTVFTGTTARADKDSWKQSCQKAQGIFSILKQESGELPVCFFGEAVVGAEALSAVQDEGVQTQSLDAYKKGRTASVRGGVCGAFNAELVTAKDAKGTTYNFCRFEDRSVMEETTLWLGPGASLSGSLDKALSRIN
ncbi:hypothetical protein [Bdellovibrio bacteriovorus]|nr:hypothetical protein [Bdellovibrio bacteriovorus]